MDKKDLPAEPSCLADCTPMRPACYQDLLEGRPIYQRMPHAGFVEIVPGQGRHCQTIIGDTYFLGWSWKGRDLGGSQGHLPVRRFKSASHYRLETTSEPRLFVQLGPLLYHVSPTSVRDQIAREGLLVSADRTGLGGCFLASLKPAEARAQLDVWEVDTWGLELQSDSSTSRDEASEQLDPWYICFSDIPAERLTLLRQEFDILPALKDGDSLCRTAMPGRGSD